MLNAEVRKQVEASLTRPEQKPLTIFPYYVVYFWDHGGWYIVSSNTEEAANDLRDQMGKKYKGAAVVNEFPYEIMAEWKKKKQTFDENA